MKNDLTLLILEYSVKIITIILGILNLIGKKRRRKAIIKLTQVKEGFSTIVSGMQVQIKSYEMKDNTLRIIRGTGVLYFFSAAGLFLFGAFVLSILKMTQGLVLEASTGFLFMLFISLYLASLGYQAFKKKAPSKLSFTIGGFAIFYGISTVIIKNYPL